MFNKKNIGFKVAFLFVCFLFFSLLCGCSLEDKNQATIEKLDMISDVIPQDDMYLYNYNDEWLLTYKSYEKNVRIYEPKVFDCLATFFESQDIGNDSTFTYNWIKKQYYLNVDCQMEGMKFSLVRYSIKRKKWSIMFDDDWHNLSAEGKEIMNNSGLANIMEQDVKKFESDLSKNDLTLNELSLLHYKVINNYYSEQFMKEK